MINLKSRTAIFNCGIALLLCVISNNGFAFGQTTRVSVGLGGANSNGNSVLGGYWYTADALSANGRFVVFQSDADNLVVGDTNHDTDIFVHDFLTHHTVRVDVDSNGRQSPTTYSNCGNTCVSFVISADGRYVAFHSPANDLVAGDTNSVSDIFVHNLLTKQTTRVSINSKGEQATGSSLISSISSDGRFVVFTSIADNLVTGDTKSSTDIFVHDRQTKQTTRVNVNTKGEQANSESRGGNISANGRYVVFESYADNLVANDTNFNEDVFVRDRLTNQTTRVNINSKGEQAANSFSFSPGAKISADGRFVVFHSFADNLVPDDTNGLLDVFVRNLVAHQTARVSVDSSNGQANNLSFNPNISADGRFVVFTSYSTNLSTNDTNNVADAYIHDRLSRQTNLISVDSSGLQAAGTGSDIGASISADGRYVAFESWRDNLVAGDANLLPDVFVRDRKLVTTSPTDLQIVATQKPSTLVRNNQGSYTYTINNNGPNPAYTTITHLVSNGEMVSFTPAKGKCTSYSSISICNLDLLQPGASVTLDVSVKALRTPVSQQLTLASGGRDDPNKTNNYLTANTPVTP